MLLSPTSAVAQETNTQSTTQEIEGSIQKVNLNDMTRDQLTETIPNFGGRMVREFFEYQPYISIQQFRREIGKYVDDEQVAFYEQYIYVPIDVNESDAATLMQIQAVTEAMAEALIAARPYESNDGFLETLLELLPDLDHDFASYFLYER